MNKVIGLFLVILISTVSVYAQKGDRGDRKGDPSKRMEQIVTDLKLDDKQAAEFRKVQKDFMDKMHKERDGAQEDRSKMREKMQSMRAERDTEVKKILTDEQYKQYLEKQQAPREKGKKGEKGRRK